jgi:hypothetical protein
MTEFLAPVTEGFTNMDLLFQNILKVNPITHTKTMMPVDPNAPPQTSGQVAFLKEMLADKKKTVDSLMDTAKKISPASQSISALEKAYDAAFESDISAPLPNSSASLQGFTLIFFVISFFSLAIVLSVWVNNLTGNTMDAVKTFGIFIIIFFVVFGLLRRFG